MTMMKLTVMTRCMMDDRAYRSMPPRAPGAAPTHQGVLPTLAALTPPHDGLLLLAALTGNRSLLTAWLRVERTRELAVVPGAAWGG